MPCVKGKADACEMRTLRDLLSHMSVCVVSKKSKNVEVLHIAAEVTLASPSVPLHQSPESSTRVVSSSSARAKPVRQINVINFYMYSCEIFFVCL